MFAITYVPNSPENQNVEDQQERLLKALESRPIGLGSLLKALITGHVRALLVHNIDRLAGGAEEPEVTQQVRVLPNTEVTSRLL